MNLRADAMTCDLELCPFDTIINWGSSLTDERYICEV